LQNALTAEFLNAPERVVKHNGLTPFADKQIVSAFDLDYAVFDVQGDRKILSFDIRREEHIASDLSQVLLPDILICFTAISLIGLLSCALVYFRCVSLTFLFRLLTWLFDNFSATLFGIFRLL